VSADICILEWLLAALEGGAGSPDRDTAAAARGARALRSACALRRSVLHALRK
jgi:hypothetical protein